jgi:hypothetical protein
VITDWWRERLDYDGGAWEYLFNAGAISESEPYAWRDEVWEATEEEDA